MGKFYTTDKLYYKRPYDRDFAADILDVGLKGDTAYVVLDKTLFFPEGGGQKSDKGIIYYNNNSYDVVDVQIDEDIIYHYISSYDDSLMNCSSNAAIRGEIDFSHRFSNMQQHSGEHIFSGLAYKYYGCTNVGFHLSDREVTFDYDKPLSYKQIIHLEDEVNKAIYDNRVIRTYYPTDAELLNLDYRSKKEVQGKLRLVEIEGVDLCACCAVHVKRTGEIGICKVVDYMNYKGGVRISILCGNRALLYLRSLDELTKDISRSLNSSRDEIIPAIDRLKQNLNESKSNKIQSDKRYLDLIYEYIVSRDRIESDTEDSKYMPHNIHITDDVIYLRLDACDTKALRDMVNDIKERFPSKLIAVTTTDGERCNYICAAMNIDCKKVQSVLRAKYDAKGGGGYDMIQGSVDRAFDLSDILTITDSVRGV